MPISTGYLRHVLDPALLQSAISDFQRRVSEAGVDYDAIVVRGNSGTIFGGALSISTGKPVILVRKPNDNSHSGLTVEGYKNELDRYIFVDDIIASGGTFRASIQAVVKEKHLAKCVGIYLYQDRNYWFKNYKHSTMGTHSDGNIQSILRECEI
jgi:adenine/guanine phosphoribosyltransferase-like PRPP-binding protein